MGRDKERARVWARQYYLDHRDEISAKRKANRPESAKLYREKNREEINAHSREMYRTNIEKEHERRKKYYESHKNESMTRYRMQRAKKLQVTVEKVLASEIYERDAWVCQLCKKKVNRTLKYPHPLSQSLDHIIPLSRGGAHSKANVQLAHLSCNVGLGVRGTKQTRLF